MNSCEKIIKNILYDYPIRIEIWHYRNVGYKIPIYSGERIGGSVTRFTNINSYNDSYWLKNYAWNEFYSENYYYYFPLEDIKSKGKLIKIYEL